jgi:hypothetical protein
VTATDQPGTPLRARERQQLLANLHALGAPESEARAEAALRVAELVARKGLSWEALLDAGEPMEEPEAPADWRAQALDLLRHPALTPADRTFLRKVTNWRAPGTDALARLRAIAERVGQTPGGTGE